MVKKLSRAQRALLLLSASLLLAGTNSVLSWIALQQAQGALERVISTSVTDLRDVRTLTASVVDQQRILSSYLLEKKGRWPEEIRAGEEVFVQRLRRVEAVSGRLAGEETVQRLRMAFAGYDRKRDLVITLCDKGRFDKAQEVFLRDVGPLYTELDQACDQLAEEAVREARRIRDRARGRLRRTEVWLIASSGAFLVLSIALVLQLVCGVYLPLRSMVSESSEALGGERRPESSTDEILALRSLLSASESETRNARNERDRGREQLVAAEQMASLGRLAAGVAHEIRNPLASLKLRLYSLREDFGKHPQYEDDLRVMSEEIERLDEFVRDFLAFSRPPRPQREPVTAAVVLDRTLELVRHELEGRAIKLLRSCDAGLPLMSADPQQIKRVLVNLALNSADAMGGGGAISFEAASEEDADGHRMVVLRVRDTGCGIAEDVRGRVFQPFVSNKEQGTGLGLSIAARILEEHDGRLVLESTSAEGTVFAAWVPVAEGQ